MIRILFVLGVLFGSIGNVLAEDRPSDMLIDPALRAKAASMLRKHELYLVFEENVGQWPSEILFQATGKQGIFRVMRDRISIVTLKPHSGLEEDLLEGHVWEYRFEGTLDAYDIVPHDWLDEVKHAYIQNTNMESIRACRELHFHNLYQGIDLRLYGDGMGGLEYDFILYPGADIRDIHYTVHGASEVRKSEDGLIVNTLHGNLTVPPPYAYQVIQGEETQVPVVFNVENNSISFCFNKGEPYNADEIMIIDPVALGFSTFLGASSHVYLRGCVLTPEGDILVCGYTTSSNYPVTPGAFQTGYAGSYDGFVTKFNANGSLLWSTYIGGSSMEVIEWIDVTPDGFVYIYGRTSSSNFPVTPGMSGYHGSDDIILCKFSSSGNLIWSGCIGGSSSESYKQAILLDNGMVVILGTTSSNNLNTTSNALQSTFNGGNRDLFISVLEPNGLTRYTSYLGTPQYDEDGTLKIFTDSSMVIFGSTYGDGWPVSPGAFQSSRVAGPAGFERDGYITWLSMNGQLMFSTYLGHTSDEYVHDVVMLDDGSLIAAGLTGSMNFPVTPGAFDTINPEEMYAGPTKGWSTNEGFICRFSPQGQMIWSSMIGGDEDEDNLSLYDLGGGKLVLVGTTRSYDFPATSGSLQSSLGGSRDVFVSMVDSSGNLEWSTFLGGSNDEHLYTGSPYYYSYGIPKPTAHIYTNGAIGITGYTYSGDFPTTSGAFSESHAGSIDLFYAKISSDGSTLEFSTYLGGSNNEELYASILGSDESVLFAGLTYSGDFPVTSDAVQTDNRGGADLFVAKLCPLLGNLAFSTRFGSNYANELSQYQSNNIFLGGDTCLVIASGSHSTYPTTPGAFQTQMPSNYSPGVITKFITNRFYSNDSIFPVYQEACRLSNDLNRISGTNGETIELIRNNISSFVKVIPQYQWQFSTDSIQWEDILDAHEYYYQPQATSQTTWFRRTIKDCGDIIAVSNVSKLNISGITAPSVSTNALIYLCPDGEVQLGGSPTATGGQAPYTYAWLPASGLDDSTLANPTATLTSNLAVYRLRVTDANNCSQIKQSKIIALDARVSEDVTICPGNPAQLKVTGYNDTLVTYLWTALDGSGPGSIQSPTSTVTIVNPTMTTNYRVTLDDGRSSGGDCPTGDITIEVVTPPIANAGSDHFICQGESVQLGTPGQPGVTYLWTPGNHISSASVAQPWYDGFFPANMPDKRMQYILTAIREDAVCVADYDTVNVYVSFVDAGVDGCGPRQIGSADLSGGLATFTWRVLEGDSASILGQENLPRPSVSPNEYTVYELEVNLNGAICTDEVEVPKCACPNPYGNFTIPVNCASGQQQIPYPLLPSNVNPVLYNYSWSMGDLSLLSNPNIHNPTIIAPLTSPQTYLLTATHKVDPSLSCSGSVTIGIQMAGTPVAIAGEDVLICPDNPIPAFIGAAQVPGYIYSWSPPFGLSSSGVSRPQITSSVVGVTNYVLTVTDMMSQCKATDTVKVTIRRPVADAGPDRSYCGVGSFLLGTTPQEGMSYLWEPTQVVTDSTNPRPMVTVYPGITSVSLLVYDTMTGCVADDEVEFFEVLPVQANAGPDVSFCILDGEAWIGDDMADQDLEYSWIPTYGLLDPAAPYTRATPSVTTTYLLIATRPNSQGCDIIDEVTVTVIQPGPLQVNAGPDTLICPYESVEIGPDHVAGYEYLWSPDLYIDDTDIPRTFVYPEVPHMVYTVTVTDYVNCLQGTDNVEVNWVNMGAPTQTDFQICPGDSVLIGMASIPGADYYWDPDEGLSANDLSMVYAKPEESTYYELYVELGDCETSFEFYVEVSSLPVANAGPDVMSCGQSPVIGMQPVAGNEYQWSPSTGLSNPFISNPVALPSDTMIYALLVTNLGTGCVNFDTVVVVPVPIANAGTDKIVCVGEEVMLGSPPKPGYTYTWSPAAGLSDPNSSLTLASPSTTTTYTLSVSVPGCTITDQVLVTVKEPGMLFIEETDGICMGGCTQLEVDWINGPFSNFLWSPSVFMDNPTSLNPQVCLTQTTMVTVRALHTASGCYATDQIEVVVFTDSLPQAHAGRDTAICYGQTVQLGGPGEPGYSYEWNNSIFLDNPYASDPVATLPESMEFILTVTDTRTSCESFDTILIEVVQIHIEAYGSEQICYGEPAYLEVWGWSTGSTSLTYEWSPAQYVVDPYFDYTYAFPDTTITFTIIMRDTFAGCEAEDHVYVQVIPELTPQVDLGPDLIICFGTIDSIQIGFPPQQGVVYSWWPEDGLSDPNVSNPWFYVTDYDEFEYSLEVYDTTYEGNCNSGYSDININVISQIEVYVSPDETEICPGPSVFLQTEIDGLPEWIDFTYSWFPPGLVSDPAAADVWALGTQPSNYYWVSVVPKDDEMLYIGCQAIGQAEVHIYPDASVAFDEINLACGGFMDRKLPDLISKDISYFEWRPPSQVVNSFFVGQHDTILTLYYVTSEGCEGTIDVPVIIGDKDPPLLLCPPDTVLNCDEDTATWNTGIASCQDNCDPNPLVWHKDQIQPGKCPAEYIIARVWYAKDSVGNIDSCTQFLSIQDTIAPEMQCPADIYLYCPVDVHPDYTGYASGSDNCSGIIYTYEDDTIPDCGGSFMLYRTWRATDDCGNISECVQLISVQDTAPPILVCPADTAIDCPADTTTANLGVATAMDACSDLIITYSDQVTLACGHSYTVSRTWRATDDCGNFSECVQTIVVQDTTPPLITCPPDTTVTAAYGVCEAYISLGEPVVTDECTLFDYVNTYTQTSNASGIYPAGTTHVWWAASDYCGNPSTCLQTITVRNYPMAHNDDTIVATGSTVLIPVLNNDFDCQDLLVESCVAVVTPPSQGTATVNLQTGVITYVPNVTSLNVNDTFYYSVCNEYGLRDTARVTVTYRTPPAGQLVGSDIICVGTSAMLAVYLTGEAPFTIWVSNGITTTMYSGITGNLWTRWVSPLHTTTYSLVWVQDATTLKVAGTGTALIQVLAPQSFVVTGGGIYNQGGPGVVVGLSGSQIGVSYQLYHNGNPTGVPVVGTGQPLSFGYQQLEGYYTVVGTDLVEGCTAPMTASVLVQMNPAPASCTLSGGGICCLGCYDLEIELSCSEVGIVYELLRNGNPTGRILQGTGGILVWDKLVYTGTYTVRATNPITGATQLMSGMATVQFYPLPSAVVSGSATIHQGQTAWIHIQFSGTPPYRIRFTDGTHYTMREGIMTNTWDTLVSPLITTTYHVEYVYDGHGCGDLGTGTATVTVLPPKTGSVSGLVQYASSAKPAMGLGGVKVMLVDASMQVLDSTVSDQTGQYSITDIPAGQYYLLLHHGDISGGYNATDAMLVMQHFTQQSILMPISAEAGDVNQSGFLNASDALLIAQRFVGMQSTFPAGEWVFEVHSLTITVNGEALLQDLLGLCYGDVNGSYTPVPKHQSHAGIRVQGSMDRRRLEQDGLPLYVEERVELGAVSLVLRGTMVKEVEEVLPGGALGGEVVWTKTGDELRLAWYDATGQPLPAGEEAFRLKLKPGAWDNAGSMTLEAGPGSELANGSGLRYGMVKMYHPEAVTATGAAELEVWPNPVVDVLKLRYYQPQPGQVKITLRDITQRELEVISEGLRPAGEHTWEVDFSRLPAGTYYVQLQHDSGADLIRKVVHIE